MGVWSWLNLNFTTQDPATYKANIDGDMTVAARIAAAFAPQQTATANMTVTIRAGAYMDNDTLTEKAQQITANITAPVSNPRIDRIVLDQRTYTYSRVQGAEAGSPTAPAIPAGNVPCAQILLQTSTSQIVNSMITDERCFQSSSKAYEDATYAALAGATFTGLVNLHTGNSIASNATVNLSTANGQTVHITGNTTTTAITMANGQWMECIADGAWPLTYSATTCNLNTGGANYTCSAGDRIFFFYDGTTVYGNIVKQDGSSPGTSFTKLPSLTVTQASNALTASMPSHVLDFRSVTLTTGTPVTTLCAPGNLVIPATSNLGMIVSTGSNQLIFLEAYNSGAPVLCVVNASGGLSLDETGFISPTTIGASSNSATVIYSAVACAANSPYRVIGYADVVFTTGTGWSSPVRVQPVGGSALAALDSLGCGQTYQASGVTGGSTYYNTYNKPIFLTGTFIIGASASTSTITVGGNTAYAFNSTGTATGALVPFFVIIPPGVSYSISLGATTTLYGTTQVLR